MTKQKIKYLFIGGSVIIVCAMFWLGFQNGREYIRAKAQFDEKQQELRDVLDEINAIKAKIVLYQEEKKDFEAYLFKEQDIPALLDEISKIAKDSLVNIIDMKTQSFSAVQPAGTDIAGRKVQSNVNQASGQEQLKEALTLAAMPITMKIEGEFTALLTFFNSIEDFKQLVTVNKVEIASDAQYPVLKCSYILNIYSLKTLAEIEAR